MKPIEWSFVCISFSEMYRRKFIEFVSEQGTKTISLFLFPQEFNTAVEKEIYIRALCNLAKKEYVIKYCL
jgi:hypothetical protein